MEQIILLANDTVVGNGPAGSPGTTEAVVAETPPAADSGAATSFLANGNIQLLVTMAAVFAVMYFFTIRPQKKREAQLKEIQNSIRTGDWVVTFSGMFGKAVDVGPEVVMVEFGSNKSVKIPIKKTELTKTTEPSLTIKTDGAEEK